MMQRYARVAGLRRRVIVPVRPLSPWLSAHWVGLVTPVPNAIARPLVASLVHEAVAHENDIAAVLLPGAPAARLRRGGPAGARQDPRRRRGDPLVQRGRPGRRRRAAAQRPGLVRRQHLHRRAQPRRWTRRPTRCGGSSRASAARTAGTRSRSPGRCAAGWTGWSAGSGLRRGRRDRHRLRVGEALDWWRVEEIDPGRAAAAARRDAGARPGLAGDARRAGRRRAAASTGSGRCSCRAGWPGTPTGRRCCRSTASSSAAWPATSPAAPSSRRPLSRPAPGAAASAAARVRRSRTASQSSVCGGSWTRIVATPASSRRCRAA